MATYAFDKVLVWETGPSGTLRVLRNGTVKVRNATTDALIYTLTAGSDGRVTFTTTDLPTVVLEAPSGFRERVTSSDAIEASAAFAVSEDAAVAALVNSPTSGTRAAVNGRLHAVNVKDQGALGNGTTDDTAAIQAAINAAIASGIRRVLFPVGTYIISGSGDILTATAGVEMFGPGTIKVKDANGPWNAMFNTLTNDASGLWVHGLTWDGNATNNQPAAADVVSQNYPNGKRRQAIRVDYGTGILIEGNTFTDHDSTWVVCSANSARDVRVLNNQFLKVGGLVAVAQLHDHSTVYIDAVGFEIAGNTFSAYAAGVTTGTAALGAISPLDTHGPSQRVHHNTVIGYVYGGQLSTSPTFPNVGIEWHHNITIGCGHGLHITPYTQGMSGVRIHDNILDLDFLLWRAHPWQNGGCGISMNSGDGGPISNLDIVNNTIVWKQAIHTGQSTVGLGSVANGIQWIRREAGFTAVDRGIAMRGNRIVGAPDNGIYARFSNVDGLDITGNTVENSASTALADATYSVGVYVDNYTSVARAKVNQNSVRDTQKAGTAPYGNTAATINAAYSLWSAAGNGNDVATGNTISVGSGAFVKFARELDKAIFTPQPIRVGGDYVPEHQARTTLTLVADEAYFVPILLGPGAITQAACEITTVAAGSTIEVAVYADLNGRPGKRIHALGTLSSALSSFRATTAGSFPLSAGVYWIGFAAHGGAPGIRVCTGRNGLLDGVSFAGVGAADLTGIKSAGPHTSLPATAPTASLTYGQGPLFYVVGA